MSLPAPGSRRRPRAEAPRDVVVRVRMTPAEHAAVTAAAARSGLSAGAWIGQVLADTAAHRTAAVGDIQREALGELIRMSGLIRRAGANLNQAAARLNATGVPAGPHPRRRLHRPRRRSRR